MRRHVPPGTVRRDPTPKQQRFAELYVQLGNASEAYRRAYKTSAEKWTNEALAAEAHRMVKHPLVSHIIAELRAKAAQRHAVTVDSISRELDEARDKAMREAKGSAAAVSASMGKAKLHGMLVDKHDHTSSDGSMSPAAISPELVAALVKKLTE